MRNADNRNDLIFIEKLAKEVSMDPERFHIIIVKRGSVWFTINGIRCFANAGAILCLSKPFSYKILYTFQFEAMDLSFVPGFIHFDLNWNEILSSDYNLKCKKIHCPDLRIFLNHDDIYFGVIVPDAESMEHILSIYESIKEHIDHRSDKSWSCRSRYYILKIIRILNTVCDEMGKYPNIDPTFLQAQVHIANHLHEKLTVSDICKVLLIDRNKLNRIFKLNSGCSFSKYVDKQRIEIACENLAVGDLKSTEIMKMVGFNDYGNFVNFFKRNTGVTPLQYRKMVKSERNELRRRT